MIASINDLSDLSCKLNQQSDKLNEIISSINTKLGKLNLGVEVWLDYRPIVTGDIETTDENWQPAEPHRDATLLGYCRVDDNWQLAVKEVNLVTKRNRHGEEYEEVRDPANLKPLLQATREIRARAMDSVPVLLDSMKAEAIKLLGAIEQAERAADEL
jgi:hypothetical protein